MEIENSMCRLQIGKRPKKILVRCHDSLYMAQPTFTNDTLFKSISLGPLTQAIPILFSVHSHLQPLKEDLPVSFCRRASGFHRWLEVEVRRVCCQSYSGELAVVTTSPVLASRAPSNHAPDDDKAIMNDRAILDEDRAQGIILIV